LSEDVTISPTMGLVLALDVTSAGKRAISGLTALKPHNKQRATRIRNRKKRKAQKARPYYNLFNYKAV